MDPIAPLCALQTVRREDVILTRATVWAVYLDTMDLAVIKVAMVHISFNVTTNIPSVSQAKKSANK